jgi:transposase
LPSLEELHQLAARTLPPPAPPQTVSTVEPYRAVVEAFQAQGVEGTAIWHRLGERGYTGSLSAVYRLLRQLTPPAPDVTVRVERAPGTEAQVDFGYAGRLLDDTTGQPRKAWVFVMTLAYSRHQYVEFVWDQTLPTWIALHQHAFTCFGGVPQRHPHAGTRLDNLKAGISKACFDDPQIQPTYRECAEHDGFLLAPCAPRTPEPKACVSNCTS